ncbi:MAG: helicase HerA-like domain-containing protein, partial [Burkholderiaceae bacterium]
ARRRPETMRANPKIDATKAITQLGVGEALVSFLDAKGRPGITERAYVLPPGSQIGPVTPEQRQALMQQSLVAGVYEKQVDRESAYEKLRGRTDAAMPAADAAEAEGTGRRGGLADVLFGSSGPRGGRRDGLAQTVAKSAMRSIGSAVGREIVRGVLGGILGGGRRR